MTPSVFALATRAADAPADVARRVLADSRYQRELPGPMQPPPDLSWLAWLVKPVLYGLGAVCLGLLLWWLVQLLRDWFASPASADAGDAPVEDARPGRLGDPDRLAAAGEFGEATHLLLLLAIRHLAERAGLEPARAATSRELVGLFRLKGLERDDFGVLVRQVEDYLFGGAAVDGEQYARCRTHWRRLVEGVAA